MLINLVMLILVLAVIGFLVHLITTKIAMDDTIQQAIILIVVVCVVLYVLALLTGRATWPTLIGVK